MVFAGLTQARRISVFWNNNIKEGIMLRHIESNGTIFLYHGDDCHTVNKEHPRYAEILELVTLQDAKVLELLTQKEVQDPAVSEKAEPVVVEGDTVIYNGRKFTNPTMVKIVRRLSKVDNAVVGKFVDRVCLNPHTKSAQMLMSFLEHRHLPLAVDGRFIAYKAVNNNYTDLHTGTFYNTPGAILEMPRSEVAFDPNTPCSTGFHVGTWEFAKGFKPADGRIVLCLVDPYDVVSVPFDSNCQKLRTMRYEVLCDFHEVLSSTEIYDTDGSPLSFTQYITDLRKKESNAFKFNLDGRASDDEDEDDEDIPYDDEEEEEEESEDEEDDEESYDDLFDEDEDGPCVGCEDDNCSECPCNDCEDKDCTKCPI